MYRDTSLKFDIKDPGSASLIADAVITHQVDLFRTLAKS